MIVPPFDSCEDAGYFFIFDYNHCYLSKGGQIVLWVEGGVPPYVWWVDEEDPCFWFEYQDAGAGADTLTTEGGLYDLVTEAGDTLVLEKDGGEAGTNAQYAFLNASESCDYIANPFYSETIKVRDSCGTELEFEVYLCDTNVCCTEADYYFSYDMHSPMWISRGSSVIIEVSGGCPPYKWEVDGDGFSFEKLYTNEKRNTLSLANDAADGITAIITITDSCGYSVGGGTLTDRDLLDTDFDMDGPAGYVLGGDDEAGVCDDTNYTFIFDPNNPDELETPGEVEVAVIGGKLPIVWGVAGTGWSWEEGADVKWDFTNGRTNTLYGDETACGKAVVTVSDRCLRLAIHPTGDGMHEIDGNCCCDDATHTLPSYHSGNPTTIDPESQGTPGQAIIQVSDGCPDYTFEVGGTGFWLDDGYSITSLEQSGTSVTVYADSTACGVCTVTITDNCGDSCSGVIKCTSGAWDACVVTQLNSGSASYCCAWVDQYYHNDTVWVRAYCQKASGFRDYTYDCSALGGPSGGGDAVTFCGDNAVFKGGPTHAAYYWSCP